MRKVFSSSWPGRAWRVGLSAERSKVPHRWLGREKQLDSERAIGTSLNHFWLVAEPPIKRQSDRFAATYSGTYLATRLLRSTNCACSNSCNGGHYATNLSTRNVVARGHSDCGVCSCRIAGLHHRAR